MIEDQRIYWTTLLEELTMVNRLEAAAYQMLQTAPTGNQRDYYRLWWRAALERWHALNQEVHPIAPRLLWNRVEQVYVLQP